MNWFIRMWIFIAIVFVDFGVVTLLEKYSTQIRTIVKKIVRFLAEMAEDALIIILTFLAG